MKRDKKIADEAKAAAVARIKAKSMKINLDTFEVKEKSKTPIGTKKYILEEPKKFNKRSGSPNSQP